MPLHYSMPVTHKLPSIFAWSKAFNPCGNRSIDQILLGIVLFIFCHQCRLVYKRQDGVNPGQDLNEASFVLIINNTPSDSRGVFSRGRFLGFMSRQNVGDQYDGLRLALTFLLRIVISCFFVAIKASTTSRASSIGKDQHDFLLCSQGGEPHASSHQRLQS